MFRLSRKDQSTGKITHSIEQQTNVLSIEHEKDWGNRGPYDLIAEDITQELADQALAKQKKKDALAKIKVADMAAVTTLPALIDIVKDLVEIVKGDD